jgi:ABC-2 type transport system permease protein
MIVWAATSGSPVVMIATAVVGIANGFAAAWLLGRVAIGYLSTRMVDVFSRIRYGRIFRDKGSGLLDQIAASTLKGEQVALEAKQKEREKRLERARTGS